MTRAAAIALLTLAGVAAVAAGCTPAPRTTFPPIGTTPGPAGDATAATKQQIVGALAAVGLQASDGVQSYRPPEGPLLAAAPRTILEVPLSNDPEPGRILIYALGSAEAARIAANDHAAYIRSNTGGINYPPGTQFVLNVVGSTVVYFSWLPASSPDAGTATIAQTLATIGDAIELRR
jgi:hypothetical protein